MTVSQHGLLQRLAANTAFGKKIDRVLEIAKHPVTEGLQSEAHGRASGLASRYRYAATLSTWRQLPLLWGLFGDTEKFFEDFPEELSAA